jgi:hypothetical protein
MGLVEPGRSWWWTTRVVQQRTVFGVPAVVVRIEVYEHRMPDARRLVSIEMVQAEETASPLVGDEARSDQAELIADRSRRVPASPGTRLSAVVAGNEPELNAEVP